MYAPFPVAMGLRIGVRFRFVINPTLPNLADALQNEELVD
jgi:hypothetical protein